MSFCIVCKYEITDTSVQTCPNCGAPVEAAEGGNQTETPANADSPEFSEVTPDNSTDAIEICDPGAFIGAAEETEEITGDEEKICPIGQTTPPLPPQADSESDDNSGTDGPGDQEPNGIKKLSPEQAARIRSAFAARPEANEQLTPEDASSIMRKMADSEKPDQSDHTPPPIDLQRSPKSTGDDATVRQSTKDSKAKSPQPAAEIQASPSLRRIAYFHKNFIQLTGPQLPRTGEELTLDDRHYILKPKKIKQQYAIAAFSFLLIILLFIAGRQFISPTLPGQGSVIGVILDEEGRPWAHSAEITLPEAGKKVTSDATGFFRFDGVSTGTYVVRYEFPDGTVGTENMSIISDQITTVSLGRADAEPIQQAARPAAPVRRVLPADNRPSGQSTSYAPPVTEKSKAPDKPAAQKKYSALKLKANVENAKLAASGQILGLGNLTYKKLMPGKHNVMVTKEGYKAWKGTVTLKPDQTYTLSVKLEKIAAESPAAEPEYTAEDFYQSGRAQLSEGNSASAIADLTEAIRLDPSLADAFWHRAIANHGAGNNNAAVSDYVRAGELFTGKKRYETAQQMFAEAININKKSASAYLGQAGLYQRRGDKDKAVKALKNAIKYDKKNFEANFALGKLYFSMSKHKYADEWLRKAKDLNSSTPEVYHYLMLNYFARDDFGKVKNVYSDFKGKMSADEIAEFKRNPKYEPIIRVVGEYERP